MRKLLATGLVALAITAVTAPAAHADPPRFGIKAGWLYTNLNGDLPRGDFASLSTSGKSSFSGGAFALVDLGKGFALQPEILFSRRVSSVNLRTDFARPEIDRFTVNNELSVNYLEVPVLVRYAFGSGDTKPFLYAGPEVAFKLAASSSTSLRGDGSFTTDINDAVKSTQFGLVFGAGTQFGIGHHSLVLDARYTMGLTNAFDPIRGGGRAPGIGGPGNNDRPRPDLGLGNLKQGAFSVMVGYVF